MNREPRLKVFVAAAIARSITRAAEKLEISQPAVSRHIKLLEEDVGCALFRRNGRGIELTDSGQQLFEVVNPAFNRIDAVVGQLQLSAEAVAGHLRIASVHTLNTYFVVPLLQEIMTAFPNLSLQMFERSSLDVGELVERGLADVGLAYDTMISSEKLQAVRLQEETMQVFYGKASQVQIDGATDRAGKVELTENLKFVAPPVGYALRQLMDQHLGQKLRHSIEVETITLMLDAVHIGLGVCILPANMPRYLIEDRGLMRRDIVYPQMSRSVVLITHRHMKSVPVVAHIIDRFVQAAKQIGDKE
ncbi:LysR family transcriptional regulator [Notoacmeibacter marinus]|uniref:LysR family transcriptional regulator n=1 Tax=Notoacmeibacter marinus TaxID=1876515 RepID=UPI001303DF12|nr:LysR family transcriptional regulator [Notoacmeibacter marinus]